MNVIIVGAGKVGFTLAETLASERHSITVVDTRSDVLSNLSQLDVITVKGNGGSYRVLREAGIHDCDLLIAVTNQDEVNLLCCLIAKKAADCRTIARVRNPDYYQEVDFIKDELGLSLSINPELSAANDMYQLIRVPSATEINSFAKGKVNMITLPVPNGSPWAGKNLIEISASCKESVLIAMITRDLRAIIPDGRTVLQAGDQISLVVDAKDTLSIFRQLGLTPRPIRSVMIAGGSTVAYYLARRLIQSRIHVSIIEMDRGRCAHLSELLPKANIICGNASSERLLMEEGLAEMDAFVSLTNFDEENIMLSLYANKVSHAKLITKVNKANFNCIINDIPVGSIISPKNLTAETILRYARALHTSPDCTMDAVYKLADDQAEALSFTLTSESAVTHASLAQLPIRKGILICAILRDGKLIVPSGQDMLLPGDGVIVVTTHKGIDDINRILE